MKLIFTTIKNRQTPCLSVFFVGGITQYGVGISKVKSLFLSLPKEEIEMDFQ